MNNNLVDEETKITEPSLGIGDWGLGIGDEKGRYSATDF